MRPGQYAILTLLKNGAHAVSLEQREIAVGGQNNVEVEAGVLIQIDIGLRQDAFKPDRKGKEVGSEGSELVNWAK